MHCFSNQHKSCYTWNKVQELLVELIMQACCDGMLAVGFYSSLWYTVDSNITGAQTAAVNEVVAMANYAVHP